MSWANRQNAKPLRTWRKQINRSRPARCAGASRMIGAPNEASLCQEVPSVLFAAFEVPFGRCGFTSDR